MKIKFKIKRYNPAEGEPAEPYFQAYILDVEEGMTVLEALLKIADEHDPTLSFRRSCRSSICGSCAVNINGFTRLACSTQVLPEHARMGDMVIEPLSNHAPLKDLVVDFNPFWSRIEKVAPYLTPIPERARRIGDARAQESGAAHVTSRDQEAIDRSQRCIMCGCCNSECNALEIDDRYIGPAALAKAWRLVGDVREGNSRKRLERLSEDHGMWNCVRCVHCTQYCPKEVSPLKQIESLRSRAMKEGVRDNPGAKHVEAMADSIKRVGRLDEAAMTFRTLGFLRSLGMIPFGLKMERHGKMPKPLLFPQIENIAEVRDIYEEAERLEKEDRERNKG